MPCNHALGSGQYPELGPSQLHLAQALILVMPTASGVTYPTRKNADLDTPTTGNCIRL
jgi:hypothetical protein